MSKGDEELKNDLGETQDKLEKFLRSNNLVKQPQMYPELSFLLPNVTKSLLKPKKNESNFSERLWGELQFQIATIAQQPEWPELVASAQQKTDINIETLIINVNLQVEGSDRSKSNSGLSLNNQIGLASLFIALYPHIVNEDTRTIVVSILNILHTIFAQLLQP
ncbi:hypothetical protein HSX37_16140|uniref:Uncharacterized protein n=1 Tax=Dendrosporobacter quercicolus TaxID=146817 RepID=A0A1G9ZQS7_9FIRM|nr:hypothetical protein [Dendrosporobacter quercicolus]NSL49566.1 hypothetical protein [Dendrosporobacter quercicolus DSM 1736]SDN22963.1 hypothetical protein SAMN04488502_11521 [Dendrosporobacter quercicolus]